MMLDFGLFVVTFFILGPAGGASGGVTHGPCKAKASVAHKEPDDENLLSSDGMNN